MKRNLIGYFVVLVLLFMLGLNNNVMAVNNVLINANKIAIQNDEEYDDDDEEDDDETDGDDEEGEDDEEDDNYDEISVIEDSKIIDVFKDARFAEIIKDKLGKTSVEDIITQNELDSIMQLDLSCASGSDNCIEELRGIKFLRNIEDLNLTNVESVGADDISDLINLKQLNLENCSIFDIDDLADMIKLEKLIISNNDISDLNALKDMVELTELEAQNNSIKKLDGLQDLVKLTNLNLSNNEIRDIENLKELKELTMLNLDNNKISNISSLSNLTKLEELTLNNNKVINVNDLENCLKLKILKINREFDGKTNGISDISALKGLNDLAVLELENHSIGDMSVFVGGFMALTTLKLNNQYHVEVPVSPEINEFSILNNYYKDNEGKSITPNSISDSGSYDKETNKINWKDFGAVDELTFSVNTHSAISHQMTGHIIIPLGIPVLTIDVDEVSYTVHSEVSEEEFFEDIGVDIKLTKASLTNAYGTITSNFVDTVNLDELGEYSVTVSATASTGDVLEDKVVIVKVVQFIDKSIPVTGYDPTLLVMLTLAGIGLSILRIRVKH